MAKKLIKKKPAAKKTAAKKTVRKSAPKLKKDQSVVKNGKIYCVNHVENSTPYWGGTVCDNHQPHDGDLIRWTCAECVAKVMPPPKPRQVAPPVVDPETGVTLKRKRGRPRKNPPKPMELDENGNPIKRGRGRPKGVKNKATIEKEKLISEGKLPAEPKRGRGRPKGVKNSTKVL